MIQLIQCPLCSKAFPLTEALAAPIVVAERARLEEATRAHTQALAAREQAVVARETAARAVQADLDGAVAERLAREAGRINSEAEARARARLAKELAELGEAAAAVRAQLAALDEERARIRSQAQQDASDSFRLKLAEKDKQLGDMKKQVDEAQRIGERTSQQLQGEVQEEDLAAVLRKAFPLDEVTRKAKGQNGADIVQRVRSPQGQICGTILWECKRTKNWSDTWLGKLRDDQRAEHADLAALVSTALPEGTRTFAERDGVWIMGPLMTAPVASMLRAQLMQIHDARATLEGHHEKAEQTYAYVTGPTFRQRFEAILEPLAQMQEELDSEKRACNTRWQKREKHIERATNGATSMLGEVQGIAGRGVPEIETDAPEAEHKPAA